MFLLEKRAVVKGVDTGGSQALWMKPQLHHLTSLWFNFLFPKMGILLYLPLWVAVRTQLIITCKALSNVPSL